MPADRRAFLASSLAVACGANVASGEEHAARIDGMSCLDYGRSFIGNSASFNNVRFWVESRTVLIDGDQRSEYYQCGSCKSENTFAEKELFKDDNYDFLPVLGDGRWLVFRRPASLSPSYRSIKLVEEVWGPPIFKLREARKLAVLDTWEKIRDFTAAGTPIVARTELSDEQTGLKAVIECPVKTMNISLDKQMYQVDTGPVCYPDLSQRCDPRIDCLRLAFVAFNAPHFADFVVEQPTEVVAEGEKRGQTYHYSGPFSKPAKNTLLAVEDT